MASLYLPSRVASFSAVALLAASLASAQVYKAPESDVEAKSKAPVTLAPESVAVPSAMRVFIDPATGKIRQPTAEEQQEFSRSIDRQLQSSGKTMTIKTTASGMRMMELDESFMNYSVVRVNADGTLSESCVIGPKAAADLVLKPVKVETQKLEEQ